MTNEALAQKLETEAQQAREAAQESFDRCDTDGFVSQWAYGITAQLKDKQAELARAGGMAEFPALFKDGRRVRAKIVDTPVYNAPWKTQRTWLVLDEAGNARHWIAYGKQGPRSKLVRLGYTEGWEQAPAVARLEGKGSGLSGSCWVAVRRADGGFPADAVVA